MGFRTVTALVLPWASWQLSTEGVRVRFVNTPTGQDVVTDAPIGANLLNLGDEVGLKIPRACRNGLCGSCVVDVVEDGALRTIKACSTKLAAAPDGGELVVDVYRMQGGDDEVMASSMARFADGWEDDFVPDFKQGEIDRKKKKRSRARELARQVDTKELARQVDTLRDPLQSVSSEAKLAAIKDPHAYGVPPWEVIPDDDFSSDLRSRDEDDSDDDSESMESLFNGVPPWERVW